MCDRVLFLARGKILLEGDPKTLPGEHGKENLEELFIAVAGSHCRWGGGMNLKRTGAIALRQFYLMRAEVPRAFCRSLPGLRSISSVGIHHQISETVTKSGINFVPAILGAVLLWDFLVRVMQGVTTTFFEDVWSRNFLNIFATPLSIFEYVGGLRAVEHGDERGRARRDACPGDFGLWLSFFGYGLLLIPFLLDLFLFGIALGIFCAAVVLRLGRRRMVDLADSGAAFAIRRRFLSALGAADMDAGASPSAAAFLCFRSHAQNRRGQWSFAALVMAGRRA